MRRRKWDKMLDRIATPAEVQQGATEWDRLVAAEESEMLQQIRGARKHGDDDQHASE